MDTMHTGGEGGVYLCGSVHLCYPFTYTERQYNYSGSVRVCSISEDIKKR